MPGNEVGDRVHNFFAQDNLPHGQHQSQVADGSWPSLNNNFWAGSQKQVGVSSSSLRNYNPLQSEFGVEASGHPLHVSHDSDFTRTSLRPDFARSQPSSQQQNSNGYMYGHQDFPVRRDEANFLGVDTESDRYSVNPRGLFMSQSQQGVSENIARNLVRSNTSDNPVSFDLFGGQQHMNGQQSSVLHGLPQQQSGFAEMQQQLQQQLMFRKMQELHRQKELQQLDARQQNPVNQVSFARQASGGHPQSLIIGNPIADASTSPWGEFTSGNTNWLQRASPSMNGTSPGPVFSLEQGQAPHSMGFGHQQVDQSMYGVSLSNSRGNLNQYARMDTEKTSNQQMPAYINSFSSQYSVTPNQTNMQDGSMASRQGFQGKNPRDNASGWRSNSGVNVDHLEQLNSMKRNPSVDEFQGRQELVGSSEVSHDKKAIDDAATLDPTEEKILFGSDDNIWDAFGADTITGEGTPNLLDSNGFLNGLPSVQSGSWSALMQSAVAETSSNDMGQQEELAGLSCQNAQLGSGAHQPSKSESDGGENRRTALTEDLRAGPAVSFGSVPSFDGANTDENLRNAMGFQLYGQELAYEHGEGPHVNSSKGLSSGGSMSFNRDQKPHAEGSQIYENSRHSLEVRMDGNTHWTSQQSASSQLIRKANDWNGIESVRHSGDGLPNLRSEQSSQHPQSHDWRKAPNEDGRTNDIWKVNSGPKSSTGLESVRPSVGNPQVLREGSALNTARTNLSNGAQVGEDYSQFVSNNHPRNYWKHADSSLKTQGTEGLGKSMYHLNKGSQVSESSLNSSEKEELKMHEIQSSGRNDNSSGSYQSNKSQPNAGGLRENLSTDASDSRSLLGGRQKMSNQAGRRTAPQKFQYHPMGDLIEDADPSSETRQGSYLQSMSQQHSSGLKGQDQGHWGQSKLLGQVPRSSVDTGKGHALDQKGEAKRYDESRSRGMFPGYVPNMFGSADKHSGLTMPHDSQTSQNMLELLHKVDQSREHGTMKHFNSSEQNHSSDVPDAENSDGSVGHLQRSQSSSSQGFGLQLAPPLQRFSVGSHASPRTSQIVHSNPSTQTEIRVKGHPELAPPSSVQSLPPSQETPHGELKSDRNSNLRQTGSEMLMHKMSGNFPSPNSGFSYSRSQTESPSIFDTNKTTSVSNPLEKVQPPQPLIGEKYSVSQPGSTSILPHHGTSSRMITNLWTNVPAQEPSLGTQAPSFHANHLHPHQSNIVESASSGQNLGTQDAEKKGNFSSELRNNSNNLRGFGRLEGHLKGSPSHNVSPGSTDLVHKMDEPQWNESLIRHSSDISSVNPASTQTNLEAFGRSLKPNNFHESYSLLNQMRAMKDSDSDPSNKGSKRLKGPENFMGNQQLVDRSGQPNEVVAVQNTTVTSVDSKMLSFLGTADKGEKSESPQLGNAPSRDMLMLQRNDSLSYAHGNSISLKPEHTQISQQMAPSWFNQYGTFKNGQIMPEYGMQKGATMKTVEQPFSHGNSSGSSVTEKFKELASSGTDTDRPGVNMQNLTPDPVSIEHLSSPLPTSASDRDPVALGQKKRKSPQPWHEEVSQSSRILPTLCMAEAEWASAANRCIEKVEDNGETVEHTAPLSRSKRRLVLTTQLMQQLLRPPPATILSADACSDYESLSYFVARLTLGDTCNLISSARSSSGVPLGGSNLSKPCEGSDDQHLAEVLENFMSRAKKLEIDLSSVEKRPSVLDLRVECQDLEKFSVINRFAKFHGRGQPDGVKSASSSDAAANAQKPVPQRYVVAVPLPKNLPDRVQCLSL